MDKDKYYDSGKQKLISEDYEGAIADLSKVIEFNPTDERAFVLRADSKFYLAVNTEDDDLLIDAITDYKKALELGSIIAEGKLDGIEESLRENAKSDDEDAKACAKILKEHFDKDSSLKDKSEDEKELTELTPLKSDSFYYSLRRMIQYIPLDSSKWAAFLTLKRLTWFIEDEDEDEDTIERVRNEVSSFESLEENMISDYLIADDTTDWLKEEWSIGDNKNVCAFVDRDDFMRSLTRNDHEQSKYIVQFFEKCWNIACIEEKYQKWILNQEYENINFWFFKGDIYVVDPDYGVTITFKKKEAERIFTPTQLGHFVDRDAVNIDEDCCLMILSQITKYGDEDDYPTYLVQDLVDFWELPSDCLKYAINY